MAIKFISAQEFNKLGNKYRQQLIKFFDNNSMFYDFNGEARYGKFVAEYNCIPLLTEGELREFIETTTQCRMETTCVSQGLVPTTTIELYNDCTEEYLTGEVYRELSVDLLHAYLGVACKVIDKMHKDDKRNTQSYYIIHTVGLKHKCPCYVRLIDNDTTIQESLYDATKFSNRQKAHEELVKLSERFKEYTFSLIEVDKRIFGDTPIDVV